MFFFSLPESQTFRLPGLPSALVRQAGGAEQHYAYPGRAPIQSSAPVRPSAFVLDWKLSTLRSLHTEYPEVGIFLSLKGSCLPLQKRV